MVIRNLVGGQLTLDLACRTSEERKFVLDQEETVFVLDNQAGFFLAPSFPPCAIYNSLQFSSARFVLSTSERLILVEEVKSSIYHLCLLT